MSGIDYKQSGVNIDAGNEVVRRIKALARGTYTPNVLSGIGSFGGLFRMDPSLAEPVLVASADGVGTKLKLAFMTGVHDTIGADLVNHCVNDILVRGASPLFFLDYLATGRLSPDVAEQIVKGVARACGENGCALLGGETAEMPGMYTDGEYDLAGFCVGIVEKSKVLDGSQVKVGDKLIGIASSGPHSNGYSLIRKIVDHSGASLDTAFADSTLGEVLLTPTRIYVKSLLSLLERVPVHALAHITGGGLTENLPRVLMPGIHANIQLSSWEFPPVFKWLQEQGNVSLADMLTTFNCGIGMIVCVAPDDEATAKAQLIASGETVFSIGELIAAEGKPEVVYS